jgi:hypothetical protein
MSDYEILHELKENLIILLSKGREQKPKPIEQTK